MDVYQFTRTIFQKVIFNNTVLKIHWNCATQTKKKLNEHLKCTHPVEDGRQTNKNQNKPSYEAWHENGRCATLIHPNAVSTLELTF